MRHTMTTIAMLGLSLLACGKGDKQAADPPSAKSADPAASKPAETPSTKPERTPVAAGPDVAAAVGVQAGGIARDAADGSTAIVKTVKGTVEVRRVGEPTYAAAKADLQLHGGDVVRTGDGGAVTIVLADESVIEVAEATTLGIASRHGSADPASGAAVLGGLARFTVSARAPGEGAFRVYTPAGVAIARGTAFGVGVAASGEARVGVESGAVEVIGLAAVDAKPVAVEGGASLVLAASGELGSPSPWPTDDWGTWRDDAEAKLEASAAIDAHAAAMTQLSTSLNDAYADLGASADSIATFEANAAASADNGDAAAYEASLPDGAATIDASFQVAGRVEALTWAYASHATLATDIYVRHPAPVEPRWAVIAPQVDAAVLWPKRFEVTAVGYLEPLRMQYYVHHPRGRVHAALVGITVPAFYAQVQPPPLEPARVRARVKTPIWVAPEVRFGAVARPVWVATPAASWHAKVRITAAPLRAGGAWYVRPPTLKSKLLLGVDATGTWTSQLAVSAPEPRAKLAAAWSVPVGMKIKVGAPDPRLAAKARANIDLAGGGRVDARVRERADLEAKAKLGVPAVKAKLDVRVPAVDVKAPAVKVGGGVKAKAGGAVKLGGDAVGGAKAGMSAGVKVKAPEVKVKTPSVKVKGEAKGTIKLGL